MKRLIGFMAWNDAREDISAVPSKVRTNVPVKSLVKVRFDSRPIELAYYNDKFDLQQGDVVYVSGKLAGEPGVVTSVTTKFRIHTSEYERVLALLDLTFHGSFTKAANKMVCFDTSALTPEQFGVWVTPPDDLKKKRDKDEDSDEIISGEGYTIDIDHIEDCEDLIPAIMRRAIDYCSEGRVRYLCVRNGVGCAYIEGSKWYHADFHYADGMITDLFCDCPYPGLCKHEVAIALTLQMLFTQPQISHEENFVALDHGLFWQLVSRSETIQL